MKLITATAIALFAPMVAMADQSFPGADATACTDKAAFVPVMSTQNPDAVLYWNNPTCSGSNTGGANLHSIVPDPIEGIFDGVFGD